VSSSIKTGQEECTAQWSGDTPHTLPALSAHCKYKSVVMLEPRIGNRRDLYCVSVGKPEGKRPLGRSRHRWEDIKMDRHEVGCEGMDWIDVAEDWDRWRAVVNAAMNFRVP
jgi:hypothetical protein